MADSTIQEKIDQILDRVKETGSGLTIAQLGLVTRVRINNEKQTLTLFLKCLTTPKACCAVMNLAVLGDVEAQLKKAFQAEFPGFEIVLANA